MGRSVTWTEWLTSGHPYDIVVGGDNGIWFNEPTANKIGTFGWDNSDYTRRDDPTDQTLVPIGQGPAGQTTVSPNLGKAVITVPLDFQLGDVTVPDCDRRKCAGQGGQRSLRRRVDRDPTAFSTPFHTGLPGRLRHRGHV